MKGFTEFVREQGVVGLAVGFILGASVAKLVNSLVEDIINPIVGVILGTAGDLASLTLTIGTIEIRYGHFLAVLVDFLIIAAVVYYGVKLLKLDQLDKKKVV